MNVNFDNSTIIVLKAFEELHPNEIVRLYYGKAKRINKCEHSTAIGLVVPLLNPSIIKRNCKVKILVCGVCFLPLSDEVKTE